MNLQKCDRCRKLIKKPYSEGHVSLDALDTGLPRIDLCSSCSPVFLRFVRKYAKIKKRTKK